MRLINLIFVGLLAHAFSDYFLQTDYMAKLKNNSNYILFIHCACYTLGIYLCYLLFGFVIQFTGLLFVMSSHFLIDGLKIKLKNTIKESNLLAIDQALHLLVLLVVIKN